MAAHRVREGRSGHHPLRVRGQAHDRVAKRAAGRVVDLVEFVDDHARPVEEVQEGREPALCCGDLGIRCTKARTALGERTCPVGGEAYCNLM